MSYLQDKKNKDKKKIRFAALAILVIAFLYFSANIFNILSKGSLNVFSSVVGLSSRIKNNLHNISVYFTSKNSLLLENQNLKNTINENEARMANYEALFNENEKLKEILLRKHGEKVMLLAGIIGSPNQSPYDTLLLDAGESNGVKVGDKVFAYGDIPIGVIAETAKNSAKVRLFSTPGERLTSVLAGSDTFVELVGRGRGNFEAILPRDFELPEGTLALLPGIYPYTVAEVVSTISDPRDSYKKALLKSPINIFELKFVEISLDGI